MRKVLFVIVVLMSVLVACTSLTPTGTPTPAATGTSTPVALTPTATPTANPTATLWPTTPYSLTDTPVPPIMSKEVRSCIYGDGYEVQPVLSTAFGLPSQIALLPNGDIAISDTNLGRISLLSSSGVRTLVSGETNDSGPINWWAVAVLPDGGVVYSRSNGEIMAIDPPYTGEHRRLGATPEPYMYVLAADAAGNVYAAGGRDSNLYRLSPGGSLSTLATDLPFPVVSDIDIGTDGTVYVAGFNRVVAVDPSGEVSTIVDGLNFEPVWVEVAPDGNLYINELSRGLQRFDPADGQVTSVKVRYGFGDFVAVTSSEFIFHLKGLLYRLNIATNAVTPLLVNAGNSSAFAAAAGGAVFFATPPLDPVLDSHIVQVQEDGTSRHLTELSYSRISAADVDKSNRLNLATDEGFVRIEPDGSITSVPPKVPAGMPLAVHNMAVGPDGLWYVIMSDYQDSIQVYRVDEFGGVSFLPITFNRESFGGVFAVQDARIDVGDDGRLALIVTAIGSPGQGPSIQRVFRANADGTDLREVANLDSQRIAGMVDIAVGPDEDIFVLTVQGSAGEPYVDEIHRIDRNRQVSRVVHVCGGRDPEGIDVDPSGSIWFGTTLGIFRAVPVPR